MMIPFLLVVIVVQVLLLPPRCCSAVENNIPQQNNITLRAGVLLAPPFAMLEDDGVTYTGFQPDLLERLKIFAMEEDGINLNFELSKSPPQYASALDIVANDCNTTKMNNDCDKFDLIVGDYYCNADRSTRVDFTPAWLRTTMSTLKYISDPESNNPNEINNMQELEAYGLTACVPEGTYLATVVMGKYPNANYYLCPSPEDCIESLKSGKCALYAEDELLLRYRVKEDTTGSLKVTKESFNTQYLVWPMSYNIDPQISSLIKKLFYKSVSNATLDDLYYTYFEVKTCPIGFAGENCTDHCDPDHGKADATGDCVCESTSWIGEDCSTKVVEDKNMIRSNIQILGYSLFGFNAIICIICAVWLVWKRHTSQVIIMQPLFLGLILLGCLISSSTIIALAQQSSSDGPVNGCMAIPWLYSIGFSITFGSLFAKIRRVQSLFKMTVRESIRIIGFLIMVDVIILVTWTIIDPLRWTRVVLSEDKFGEPLESEGYCTSEYWPAFVSCIAAFHLLLLIVACLLCYKTRHISSEFCEARYISIALLSNLQIFLIGLPVLAIVGPGGEAAFMVRSLIIWINDLVVVGLIFGNLMWAVHTHDPAGNDPNVDDYISDDSSHVINDENPDDKLNEGVEKFDDNNNYQEQGEESAPNNSNNNNSNSMERSEETTPTQRSSSVASSFTSSHSLQRQQRRSSRQGMVGSGGSISKSISTNSRSNSSADRRRRQREQMYNNITNKNQSNRHNHQDGGGGGGGEPREEEYQQQQHCAATEESTNPSLDDPYSTSNHSLGSSDEFVSAEVMSGAMSAITEDTSTFRQQQQQQQGFRPPRLPPSSR